MIYDEYPRILYIDSDDIIWEHDIILDEMHPLNFRGQRIPIEEGKNPTFEQVDEECCGALRSCSESEVLLKYCKVLEEKLIRKEELE